jgi:hypothetical protein
MGNYFGSRTDFKSDISFVSRRRYCYGNLRRHITGFCSRSCHKFALTNHHRVRWFECKKAIRAGLWCQVHGPWCNALCCKLLTSRQPKKHIFPWDKLLNKLIDFDEQLVMASGFRFLYLKWYALLIGGHANLYMWSVSRLDKLLPVLARTVVLDSESRGSHDHISLSLSLMLTSFNLYPCNLQIIATPTAKFCVQVDANRNKNKYFCMPKLRTLQ